MPRITVKQEVDREGFDPPMLLYEEIICQCKRTNLSFDPRYSMRNLFLQSLKLRQGIGLEGPLFISSVPSLACPWYISEHKIQLPNPLGSSHSCKVSPPGLQDAFPN